MNVRLWSNSIQNEQLKQGMMNSNLDGKVETRKKYFQKKISLKKKKKIFLTSSFYICPFFPFQKWRNRLGPNVHHTNLRQIKKHFYASVTDLRNTTWRTTEAFLNKHLRWCFFAKIVNGSKSLTIFVKNSILDTWRSSK